MKNILRDSVIYGCTFILLKVIFGLIFKPSAVIDNEDDDTQASLYSSDRGIFVTNVRKDEDPIEILNIFFHIMYTITNIILTAKLFKAAKED